MLIPFPERFQWKYVAVFSTLLFILQLAAGTDPLWALLVGVFTVVFTAAFNSAGGLYYPSGAFIFFTGTLVLLLGVTWKAVLFEPGESHLHWPNLDLLIYIAGMCVMWLTAVLSKMLRPARGLLSRLGGGEETFQQAAIGCMILGFAFTIIFGSGGTQAGSVGSAILQLNRFPQFAIMLATAYEIRKTNGRRAWNWVVLLTGAYIFIIGGVIYSSKEGMFQAPTTWLITVAAYGYRLRFKQILLGGLAAFLLVYYMVPYSQYVRTFRDKEGSRQANQKVALEYIFKLNQVRELAVYDDTIYLGGPHFYDKQQGLMDRLCMLAFDDALIARTEDGYVFGLWPTYQSILDRVPKFILKNKVDFGAGNVYGREIGVLGDDDVTTGISFSPAADAFHQARWFGVFVVLGLVTFAFFLVSDSLTGSVRAGPWALLLVVFASHAAPEGLIQSMISEMVTGTFGIIAMALVIRFVFPIFFRILTGGQKTDVRRSQVFGLGVRQLNSAKDSAIEAPPL